MMRRLPVNLSDVEMAMRFDPDGLLEPQTPYLDLRTGEVIWVWESDQDFAVTMNAEPAENQRNREAVEAEPDRFIAIPELDTFDDNEMLSDFLHSNWTDDAELRRRVSDAYRGSVGRWKRAIDHDPAIIHAWNAFEEQAVRRRALEFLADLGIEPIDTDQS